LWSINVFLVIEEIQLLLEYTYGVFFFNSLLSVKVTIDELFKDTVGSALSTNHLDTMKLLLLDRASNKYLLK